MSSHAGRNDPCPCGSGRKYKHCCLRAADAIEMRWHQLRHAEGRLIPDLLRVALDAWGKDGFRDAQRQFYGNFEPPEDPASDPEFESLFLTWFGLRFAPATRLGSPAGVAAVHQHLAAAPAVSDFDRRFLLEAARRPVSFHHVTAVDPGRSLDLEDLLTGEPCHVVERSASTTVRRGGVLYARTLTLDGVSIMLGCGSTMMPPSYRADIAKVREQLAGSTRRLPIDEVAAHDDVLRWWYLEVAGQIQHPLPPKLQNTDGDPLAPTTLHFELQCSPDEAFDALKSLNAVEDDENALLEDSSRDASGRLRSFHLTWNKAGNRLHASWDNTTLGSIEVEGASLVATVNSNRRAGRLRRQIEKRLHGRVLFVRAVVESVDAMLAQARRQQAPPVEDQSPELAEMAATLAERHWEEWLDTPVPALGGETPRQAAASDAGRERLMALLDDFEWRGGAQPAPVERLRAQLGL